MLPQAIAVAALCVAAVPGTGSSGARLVVDPQSPVVGVRALIEVRTHAASPVVAQLTSPTGVRQRLRLTRVHPGLWRGSFHFSDDGQWTVRVTRAHAVAKVLVLQPGGAVPPFKPNQAGGSKADALSGIASPGIVIGH
jgi:hypothetical protein